MTRRPLARPLLLLLRDARGRFTRVRATLAARRPRVRRPHRRPLITCVQLTLF